jgi:YegS/Rv2252/BmrU family lipid kinase
VRLAAAAVEDGARLVVAVGGDGTLHEVVNGVLAAAPESPPEVALVPGGRGSDFARGMGIPQSLPEALALLAAPALMLDVGRVTLPGRSAYFINVADAGLGGYCVAIANRIRLPIPGRITYLAASLWGLVSYTGSPMVLTLDGGAGGRLEGRFLEVAVANSGYFGGGMNIAPGASPVDGLFDIVVIPEGGRLTMVSLSPDLYAGRLRANAHVGFHRCRTLTIESSEAVPLDLDGERADGIPVTFEVLPARLPFKARAARAPDAPGGRGGASGAAPPVAGGPQVR